MNQSVSRFVLPALAVTAALLAGCLIPEKFVASVAVNADGSYTYRYEGTANHLIAASEIQKKGALSDKVQADMKAEADRAAKAPGVRKFVYEGGSRFDLSLQQDVKAGQQPSQMKVVNVKSGPDGVITISSSPLKPKDQEGLKKLGLKLDGTLEVRLPANATVIEHNATGSPGLFNKAYTWKIGGLDQRPSIRFRLAR